MLSDSTENDAVGAAGSGLIQHPQHFAAGHVRHPQVGDHQAEPLLVRQAQPLGAIRGERYIEVKAAK
jgi:hypothetical protein